MTYRYTDGYLTEVRDLAGNARSYEYGPSGRLKAAIGANGKPFLYVSYDEVGRVVGSRAGRDYTFHYAPGQTSVVEGTGPVHLFEQNSLGITTAFSSTTGMAWRLTLDALQRVELIEINLAANGRVLHVETDDLRVAADYDAGGSLVAIHHGTRSVRFTRDTLGRIIDTTHANGEVNRYFYDEMGNRTLLNTAKAAP